MIPVCLPYNSESELSFGRTHVVPYTLLFRQGVNIPEVLSLSAERHADRPVVRFLSAACSVGAETDTVLAVHNTRIAALAREQRVLATGLDTNQNALDMAAAAHHRVPAYFDEDARVDLVRTVLEQFGFNYYITRLTGANFQHNEAGLQFDIDSTSVRQPHEATFRLGSLVTDNLGCKQDVIMANNIMYHLPSSAATAGAANLASQLAEGGIFSIGGVGKHMFCGRESHKYADWLEQTGQMLQNRHGLTPIEPDRLGVPLIDVPTIFVRD